MNNQEFSFAWDEFRRYEEREHDIIRKKLDSIDAKIDEINQDRWRIKGVIGVIGMFTGTMGTIIVLAVKHFWG